MKLKKVFKLLAELGLVGTAVYFAKTLYKAKQFKVSYDINPDSLDQIAVCEIKVREPENKEMTDAKVGAFLGILYVNFSQLDFSGRLYDLTVVADKAVVTLVFPKDVAIEVTCPQPLSHVIDTREVLPEEAKTLVSINADIHTGLVIIEAR